MFDRLKNFFGFGKKQPENETVFSSSIIDQVADHLYNTTDIYTIPDAHFKESIHVYYITFPCSFDDYDNTEQELVKGNFKNLYDVLNQFYANANILPVSEEEQAQGLEYSFIHLSLQVEPEAKLSSFMKTQRHNFFIISHLPPNAAHEGFKVLYSPALFFEYLSNLSKAALFDYKNPPAAQKHLLKYLEDGLEAVCREFKIATPANKGVFTAKTHLDIKNDFTALLGLLTCNKLPEQETAAAVEELMLIKEDPRAFCKAHQYDDDATAYLADNPQSLNQIVLYALLDEHDLLYNCDWKFDPEDISWFISGQLGEDFVFEHPADTYSHDLFPYINKALNSQGLELINLDSDGDNYGFIVVHLEHLPRIIELANLYTIPLHKC